MNTPAKHLKTGGSSARSGWLSSFLRDLSGESPQSHRRRLIVAFAFAVAIVEITAMSIPSHTYVLQTQAPEVVTIAKLTRIEHRPKPTPTPKPTSRPIVHTKLIAPTHVKPHIVKPAAPSQHQRIRRIAAARPRVHTQFHLKPAIHVPVGAQGAGASTTAKAPTGGVGPGGNGTGESGTGQGTGGAPAANEPCGFVEFSPTGPPSVDRSTGRMWEYIAMTVHFPDGSQQSVDLDYPWYYPDAQADPWSDYNEKNNPNAPTPFIFPPPDKASTEPPLVQYVMKHTTAEGLTTLRDCPKSS